MEDNILLGATEVVSQYDGSGVFNPNIPTSTSTTTTTTSTTTTDEPTSRPADNTSDQPTESNNFMLYAGIALVAYFFFFKSKK